MKFVFDGRLSDSPFVEAVWHTRSGGSGGSFISTAAANMEIVVTKQRGKTWLTVRGPETQARLAPVPGDAEFFGIILKLGTFMTPLPGGQLVNEAIHLPEAASKSFWFHGAAWQFPTFENADTFIARLTREGLLTRDRVVESALQNHPHDYSTRTVRRRFLQATGLTPKAIQQIERARRAAALLQQGMSILDTVYEAGYFDQPHMTKALKYFMGQTPAQILRLNDAE